jgi:hypothetical protein
VRGPRPRPPRTPAHDRWRPRLRSRFLHGGSLERSRSNTPCTICGDISFRLDRAAIRSPQGARFRPTCVVASAPIVSSRRCQPRLDHWDATFARSGRSSGYVFYVRDGRGRLRISRPDVRAVLANLQGSGRRLRRRPPSLAPPPDGDHDVGLEQGYELRRRSLVTLSMAVSHRRPAGAAISGDAVAVSEGTIET